MKLCTHIFRAAARRLTKLQDEFSCHAVDHVSGPEFSKERAFYVNWMAPEVCFDRLAAPPPLPTRDAAPWCRQWTEDETLDWTKDATKINERVLCLLFAAAISETEDWLENAEDDA